ncbi:alpha/beta fold hydrolase [Parasulfitobacter algicola]|uniref:Alpha/beta hydrolase n=1 Tax=Parasulfitobacter algicola TaxID=2614809 RepID=A0ABX2IQF8_9RHOB|nr:alpha/beta hydrolase [Sulfitobacter algicola]NSX55107.1 alpha/beta hydrolase [Sulfitobacter algicola]
MSEPAYLDTPQGRRIAYHQTSGRGPGVIFLGGFKSDMQGSKATHLEAWAKAQGHAFLRFDYSGHGQSSGAFTDGCIGDWAQDAQAVIENLTEGPQVIVGSSMGGWISLLMCKRIPQRIAGLITIAAAPDFTEDGYWSAFDDDQRAMLDRDGHVAVPSDYGDPYIITKRLIEDGRDHLVLRSPLPLPFPVRSLQGTADKAVLTETALRLLDHAQSNDMRLTLVKDADHQMSNPENLDLITATIYEVLRLSGK